MPAVRLLGRRTGARATGGPGSSLTQPRGPERQEDAGVAGGWGRRDSGEPATGGPSCRASRKNACARKRTKRRSGSASPAARLLGRRTGARATGGPGSASTQPRGSERQEDAGVVGGWGRRDSGEPATGKTPRGRNWSSARRTCAKARVSNRSERGSRRAGSAWHPGGNSRELVPGDRSTSRAVSHRGDSTLGSDVWFAKLRASDSASRSLAAKVRAEGSGEGRERREARSRVARPTATKERDGR